MLTNYNIQSKDENKTNNMIGDVHIASDVRMCVTV